MPPPLALFFCTLLVIFLLRLDRRQSPDVSRALWLPTLWLFSVSTKPFSVWFSVTAGDAYGSVLDEQFLVGFLLLGLVVLVRRRFDWRGACRAQPWLMLLLGFMLFSILWSDLPFTCLKRNIRQLIALVMAFVVFSEREPWQAVESILRRTAYVLVPFSVLLIKYFPHYGVEFGRWSGDRMWVGVAMQKNGLGRVCIVAIIFLLWTLYRRKKGMEPPVSKRQNLADWGILLMALILLLNPDGKTSATSIVALGAAVAGYCGLLWCRRRRIVPGVGLIVVVMMVLIGFGIGLPFSGGSIGSGFNEALGRNSSFTGRADTWMELVPIAMEHPVLGCGFDGYWTPMTRAVHGMSNAHSAYLEVFNELGIIGLILFASFMLSFARSAWKMLAVDYERGSLCLCYLVMALLHGTTESSINSFAGQLSGLLLFLSFPCSIAAGRSSVASRVG